MNLDAHKIAYLQKRHQFLLLDKECCIVSSSNSLVDLSDHLHKSIFDVIPFFESIRSEIDTMKAGVEINYECIGLNLLGVEGTYDISISLDPSVDVYIMVVIEDRTRQYKYLHSIQQERNVSMIDKELIVKQAKIIEEKNKDITNSINYASRIQQVFLPENDYIDKLLPNSFVIYRPKDIVSGDFYWITERDGKIIFTASDCTGHGVPGAFMSLLCISLLNEAVNEKSITKPNEIFYEVRKGIIARLKQTGEKVEQQDGMDSVLCTLNMKNKTIEFACANNPLYLIRGSELIESEKDKQPVGFFLTGEQKPFKNQELKLQKDDTIYLFSDGYCDQFGGPRDKRFMKKTFKELLLSIQPKSMEEQKEILDKTIEEWKGDREQTDDILIIGVRFA